MTFDQKKINLKIRLTMWCIAAGASLANIRDESLRSGKMLWISLAMLCVLIAWIEPKDDDHMPGKSPPPPPPPAPGGRPCPPGSGTPS